MENNPTPVLRADIVKDILEEPSRKPWYKRQQNIFTLVGVLIFTLTAFFGKETIDPYVSYIGIAVTIIGNIIGEAWRDATKFKSAADYFLAASDEDKDVV